MSYGSISLDPVETRVTLGSAAMPSSSFALRPENRARLEPRATPDRRGDVSVATPTGNIDLSVLSPASLRAQAVTGMLEARRSDLARSDRALSEPIAAARRSLADVWPASADTERGTRPALQDGAPLVSAGRQMSQRAGTSTKRPGTGGAGRATPLRLDRRAAPGHPRGSEHHNRRGQRAGWARRRPQCSH